MKKILFILLLLATNANATDVTIPTTYATNGSVTSVNLNGNFQALAQKINGGLDNDNADTTNGYRFFETKATLPAAGSQGRTVFLTSDNSLNLDTGSAWVKVGTSGILIPSGGVFFMASGSCPSGTTDISSTYSNKYIKINATQLTSAGVVLTGTSDSTTLTAAQSGLPAHTHTLPSTGAAGSGSSGGDTGSGLTSGSTGGTSAASGHTHGLSAATTLEPSSVTMRACQVL